MLQCIEKFYQEMDTRYKCMDFISDQFEVLQLTNLIKISETELPKIAQSLVESYDKLSTEEKV